MYELDAEHFVTVVKKAATDFVAVPNTLQEEIKYCQLRMQGLLCDETHKILSLPLSVTDNEYENLKIYAHEIGLGAECIMMGNVMIRA